MPGDVEPAGLSGHSSDCDVDRRVRLQDSITLQHLGFAELAPNTVDDTQGHCIERVISLWHCQLAELLGLLRILAWLLEEFCLTVLKLPHQ